MARFDDYHRTVIGYHGTTLSTALRIVNRIEGFRWSRRPFDWLGSGIYFWEYAPAQALKWAEMRQRKLRRKKKPTPEESRKASEPIAVIASMIRLGFCLDLLEPDNIEYVKRIFESYRRGMALAEEPMPENHHKYRKLDCAVFEYAYQVIQQETEDHPSIDSTRGVYVPTGGERRVWDASWISRDTHIQLCVRNASSILGTWLHHPIGLEVADVRKALEDHAVHIQRENSPRGEASSTDVAGETDRPDGGGPGHDGGASRTGEEELE